MAQNAGAGGCPPRSGGKLHEAAGGGGALGVLRPEVWEPRRASLRAQREGAAGAGSLAGPGEGAAPSQHSAPAEGAADLPHT